MFKVIIIGKIPPPIGGVTIHVKRLIEKLDNINFNYKFLLLKISNIPIILMNLIKCKCYHLHTSNVYLQFCFSLLARIFCTKSIITYHGDLSRYIGVKNKLLLLSVKFCKHPIVLNENSLNIGLKYNKNTLKLSAFIPPLNQEELTSLLINQITSLKRKSKKLYATNAYGLTFDKNNIEIYGILDLIDLFRQKVAYGLIISDPSRAYQQYILANNIQIPENILLVTNEHSFCEILKLSDASIRNTSTDGDSLSIKESLFFDKLTFATNVVSRDKNVITYERGNYEVLFCEYNLPEVNKFELDASNSLLNLYNSKF